MFDFYFVLLGRWQFARRDFVQLAGKLRLVVVIWLAAVVVFVPVFDPVVLSLLTARKILGILGFLQRMPRVENLED